jgi:hypothetical protein
VARTRDPWKDEKIWAHLICAPFACTVTSSTAQYEIAKVNGPGVALVIYPHKTSSGHHHARVRDNNSKDKAAAERIMKALDEGEGLPQPLQDRIRFSCTFSRHMNMRPVFKRMGWL